MSVVTMPSIPSVTLDHSPHSQRPTPKFFAEPRTFSTKKELGITPRGNVPPRPPIKSCPPMSRVFPHVKLDRPSLISFRDSQSQDSLSPCYDPSKRELYFNQCFIIEKKIGSGSFGDVYRVRSKEDGKLYAVKRSKERFRGDMDRKRKLQEVSKQESLPSHPNCVRFYKAWEEKQHLYIQTELCDRSLAEVGESVHDIPEKLIWNYSIDLLMAVKHLQDHNLLHMDIKPDNIFISEDGLCKLGDFGLILDLSKNSDLSEAQEGDPKYVAPELMNGIVTKAADVFSVGISILELACDLDVPRGEALWHELRQGILPDKATEVLSSDLLHLIRLMMEPDHTVRSTAETLLRLPSIQRRIWWRRWETTLNWPKNNVFQLFFSVWAQCKNLYNRITGKDNTDAPAQHVEFDSSLSDDNVFHDETFQSSVTEGTNFNFSSSSESNSSAQDWSPTMYSAPKAMTTGASKRTMHAARMLSVDSPVKTPSQGSPMLCSSSRSSNRTEFSLPEPSSTTPPSCRKKMNFKEETKKDLLSMFDMVDSDED